jgi:hypothetical protein
VGWRRFREGPTVDFSAVRVAEKAIDGIVYFVL